jgi:hypothetical protein
MKKSLFLGIIISMCVFLLNDPAYGLALNIGPPSFTVSVRPEGTASGVVTIQNNGDSDIGILVYTQDWVYNPDGSKSFHAAGTKPLSCARWISLFPKKFQLPSGGDMAVQYTINVPQEATGGYYAVIFFESVPVDSLEKQEGMMVHFAGRLGSIVYLEVEGQTTRQGVIKSVDITPPRSDKPLEMTLSYENKGNVYIGADGTLNIIDEEGNVYGKETFGPVNTLPGDTRQTKVEWLGELEEGTYYAIVTLDIGTDEPLVEERKITISSGGAIGKLSVDASTDEVSFSVLVKNTGHLNIDTGGRIEVLKENGDMVKRLNLKKTLIAPGKERELKGSLDEGLPPGKYKAKAVILIGTRELTKEEVFSVE